MYSFIINNMTSINNSAQVMTQQSAPGANAIPALVKIGTIPTDTAIDVATAILEPVSFSQSECRFVLTNKGILHSNSRLTFALDGNVFSNRTAGQSAFFPVNIGVASLLQRVRLTVGGKTISEIEDFNHYYAYESMFVTPEQNKEREQVFTGRVGLGARPTLKNRQAKLKDAGTGTNNIESINEADSLCIDNGNDFDYDADSDLSAVLDKDSVPLPSRKMMEFQQDGQKGVFSILLADLFPFLKMNQLPLFMLKEQVAIHLTFQPKVADATDGSSQRIVTDFQTSADEDGTILRDDVKMVADYIFYPQEMMLQYQQSNANMSFNYVDYQFVKRDVSDDEFSNQLIQNVGGAGRLVTKLFTTLSDDDVTLDSILNNYHSMALDRLYTGTEADRFNGVLTSNVKYNDHFLYPVDVTNSAQQFHNVVTGEGMVPFVTREEYNKESESLPLAEYEGWEQNSEVNGLSGKYFYQVYKLNRNERVNSRGIELYNTWDKLKNSKSSGTNTATLRTYVEIIRVAQLNNGVMDVFFA